MDQTGCLIHTAASYCCDSCNCKDYRPRTSYVYDGNWPKCVCGHIAQTHNGSHFAEKNLPSNYLTPVEIPAELDPDIGNYATEYNGSEYLLCRHFSGYYTLAEVRYILGEMEKAEAFLKQTGVI